MAAPARIPLRRTHSPEPSRRQAWAALGVSAAAHGVLAAAAVLAPAPDRPPPAPAPPAVEHVAYVDIDGWPDGAGPRDRPPAREQAPAAAGVPAGGAPSGTPAQAATAGDTSTVPAAPASPASGPGADPVGQAVPAAGTGVGRGRLSPELGDPRLVPAPWRAAAPEADVERYRPGFMAALRAHHDSVREHLGHVARLTTWGWTDPAGRRWEFRDGLVFIGGRRIMSVEIQGERGHHGLARTEARQRRESVEQAQSIERERYIQERGRAVRERRDRERGAGREP